MTTEFYIWCGLTAVVTFFGSLIAVGVVLLYIPTDYFVKHSQPKAVRPQSARRWVLLAGRNLVGALILLSGIVMIFTPGQGVLAILLGLILIDFPGKHAVVRKILRSGKVVDAANRWRARFSKPPLEQPPTGEE